MFKGSCTDTFSHVTVELSTQENQLCNKHNHKQLMPHFSSNGCTNYIGRPQPLFTPQNNPMKVAKVTVFQRAVTTNNPGLALLWGVMHLC